MEVTIKHYGNSRTTPSKIIEITCSHDNAQIKADVTNYKGIVDVNLIQSLRDIADELEEQNKLVESKQITPNK